MDNLFNTPFIWSNRRTFINSLSHTSQVHFALFCAMQVKPLMKDKRSLNALSVVEKFLEGKATKEECADAYADAYAYASAYASASANAASAAASASYAAAAANAAYAAYASASYASAAAAASSAAYAAANQETIKQEQMNFLRKLLIESMSEEDKECWLLVASF